MSRKPKAGVMMMMMHETSDGKAQYVKFDIYSVSQNSQRSANLTTRKIQDIGPQYSVSPLLQQVYLDR